MVAVMIFFNLIQGKEEYLEDSELLLGERGFAAGESFEAEDMMVKTFVRSICHCICT